MRFVGVALSLSVLITMSLVAGCSGNDSAGDGTTTLPRDTVAPTTRTPDTTEPGDPQDQLPGLWLATPKGIVDQDDVVYAAAGPDEQLRSPIDDGDGGVFYVRCPSNSEMCAAEHVTEPDGKPVALGEATGLLARGTVAGEPVLLTSWTDPKRAPDFTTNVSGQVVRVIDTVKGAVKGVHDWYGWESGPFAADVENDVFAACFGEGETCGLSLLRDPDADGTAVEDAEISHIVELALSAQADRLSWLELTIDGTYIIHDRDLIAGSSRSRPIEPLDAPMDPDEPAISPDALGVATTDGDWVAVFNGSSVEFTQLYGDQLTGVGEVPEDPREIALQSSGGGGASAPSPL